MEITSNNAHCANDTPLIKPVEIMVIGGGPAGLCAALSAASLGAKVLLVERDDIPGGQLVKQTHKFFGSKKQYAGDRGIHIGKMLVENAQTNPNIEIWSGNTVLSIYEDGVVTVEHDGKHVKVKPERIILATGAAEDFLAFPGNDLPGVYGAGAVQTLMNVDGVKPAKRVLMVGAGNIGLIVSYQLKQAGIDVAAVIRRSPIIDGYLVHASKIQRSGIPVLTRHTILEAYGDGKVEGAVIAEVGADKKPIPGKERRIECDAICLAVGLSPLTELAWQAGCEMAYISELSGHVPVVDEKLETTKPGIYCAGDVSGVEEASSAMVEGRLAGVSAAVSLGYGDDNALALQKEAMDELAELRAGPMGLKIRAGMEKVAARCAHPADPADQTDHAAPADPTDPANPGLREEQKAPPPARCDAAVRSTLINDGIPVNEDLASVAPSEERLAAGPVVIVECFQEIPCDPCVEACRQGAITMPGDVNGLPVVDAAKCNGCGLCITRCPGLAIFVVDKTYSEDLALVMLPFEYVPVPEAGQYAAGLDRASRELGRFEVVKVTSGGKKNMTRIISLAVPQDLAMEVRSIQAGGYTDGK